MSIGIWLLGLTFEVRVRKGWYQPWDKVSLQTTDGGAGPSDAETRLPKKSIVAGILLWWSWLANGR